MVATPKVIGPDGVARETTIFSTTMSSRFFQGTIDSDTVDFRVSLWDAPVAGNKVWPAAADFYDEHSVNVYEGRFAFDIGSDQPYEHVPDTPLYLDIQVRGPGDADFVQLGGRQRFLSAPYAVAASRSDTGFLVGTDLDVTDTTTTATLAVTGNATVDANLGVGIGTPAAPLHVAGDARIDGILKGRVVGGAHVFCTGNSQTTKGCHAWPNSTVVTCPATGGACAAPTCNQGSRHQIATGRCYWNDTSDYCYTYICVEGL